MELYRNYSWNIFVLTIIISFNYLSSKSFKEADVPSIDDDKWLSDLSNYYFDYMGDAPDSVTNNDNDLCPPIPEVIPTHACKVKSKCESDLDCRKRTARCCYNGCVRTCRRQQDPPAVIDWVKEPRRRLSSGISWLLSGPDIAQELEPCSTTPYTDEEDPLLCPHGYVCHVEDPGDPELDLPNRGHCIPESDDKFARLGVGYVSRRMKDNSCWMDKYVLLDGASMMFKGKTCICKRGFLTCIQKNGGSTSL
ncbi:uncharacterized protein LOC110455293 [Mizuhopecten yessoensis]|uniref:uncharacterized protein LOC110455293 n=1 Tax=Mizuhopecten yessoensis TaxID=6573 RepID=UPI000B45AAFB|nr:uncharacterized protein LOC110455293 [Mizuhopecten yessoensis]